LPILIKMPRNTTSKRLRSKLNTRAAISQFKVEAMPSSFFYGQEDIIPFGIDNFYPWRINTAIKKSPTAIGCNKRLSEFIYGQGFGEAGNVVVNRDGETLNKIALKFITRGYTALSGGGLHFNFNVFGQISEIFFVDIEYIRKHKDLKRASYGLFSPDLRQTLFTEYVEVDLYGAYDPVDRMQEQGLTEYRGQLYYFSANSDIYPTSIFDSVAVSAEYERESQIYPLANIINGFSGTSIIKKPSFGTGTDTERMAEFETQVNSLSGAKNAGAKLIMEVPLDADGKMHNANLVEHLTPPNIDGMFEKQDAAAENKILKAAMMPKILLGVAESGMFNMASFRDAFDYKNSDTEFDRQIIESEFNAIVAKSVWRLPKLALKPLELKQSGVVNQQING
jgi:hypothetical protein